MTANDASSGEHRTSHQPVSEQRLDRVLTARRAELAGTQQVRANDDLVGTDEADENPNRRTIEAKTVFNQSRCAYWL